MAGYGRRGLRVGEQFDWPLFLCIVTVAILGVVNLYSATSPYLGIASKTGIADIYVTQVYWLVVGGLFGILVAVIDYRNFERIAYIVYGVGLLALAMIFVLATDVRGAARWIRFGSFAFQPSEFMKIAVILAVARFLADEPKTEARTLVELFPAFLLCGAPFALVMLQPDLGTAMIYLLTAGGMLAMTRIRASSIALAGATLAITIPLLWVFGMRDYQKARITSFLNPEADLTGTGWHAFQSQTAIGNGGIWGMGFREGTQNQFGFLPDQFSDFPFSVFAEDWGFLGVICVISLYCFISVWAIKIASMAKDRFGAAVSIGVGAMIFWHAVINMGMVLGILPVVGVTLPLFSYGGSSVLTILIGFGLLMNVSLRR